jgi:hypothetical protein
MQSFTCPRCGFIALFTARGRNVEMHNELERVIACPVAQARRGGRTEAQIPASADPVDCPDFNSAWSAFRISSRQ